MTIDVEKVLALVREVADPRWADPVCSMGDMVTLTLDEMIAFADRVAARERAALAAEPAQPVAWYVERRAPGYGDDGVKSGPWWSKNEAKRFADDHHVLRPLYTAPQPPADVPLTDEQAFDMDAVGWAYSKCVVFGLENGSMESAMMMDRLKLMLEHGITGDAK